jgi:hypothetical protein
LRLVLTRGAVAHPDAQGDPSILISIEDTRRFRAIGGTLGLSVVSPWIVSPDDLAAQVRFLATIPFQGREGTEGISIASDFLGQSLPLPAFRNAESISRWIGRTFDKSTARALIFENARTLIAGDSRVALAETDLRTDGTESA